jgi:hypothetical protein
MSNGCGYVTYKGSFLVIDKAVLQPKTNSSAEIADVTFQFRPDSSVPGTNKWPAFSERLYAEVPQVGQSIAGAMKVSSSEDCIPSIPELDVKAYPNSMKWITNLKFTGWN